MIASRESSISKLLVLTKYCHNNDSQNILDTICKFKQPSNLKKMIQQCLHCEQIAFTINNISIISNYKLDAKWQNNVSLSPGHQTAKILSSPPPTSSQHHHKPTQLCFFHKISYSVQTTAHCDSFGDPAFIICQNGTRLLCKLGLPNKMRAPAIIYMPFSIKEYCMC
jgi:hypothetical protein